MRWPWSKPRPKARKRRWRRAPRARAYDAASLGRLVADWNQHSGSADAEVIPNLRTLRARSRDLWQNNDYARRFLSLTRVNVVGHKGIRLQNRAKDTNGQLDTQANEIIEAAWLDWGRSVSMCGGYSWSGFQHAVIDAVARDGEVLIQKVRAGKYGLSLHLVEADQLDHELNDPVRRIRGGVQVDEWGRPIRYHILRNHPGDEVGPMRRDTHRIVPADDIEHPFIRERPGQTRGAPWLITAAYRLKMLGAYEEAELVASRLAASKMGFYTSEDGDGFEADDEDADGSPITEAEPGTFEQLPAGMDFKSWDPQHPTAAYGDFHKSLLRGICSGLGASYVAIANDLEGVSYSSIRQGELSDRDAWRLLQNWFVENVVDPIFRAWLPMALLSGELDLPARKLEKFNQPHWMARGWNWVDPQKEIAAQISAVRNGFRSLTDVLAEQGLSVEDVFERLAAEKELAEKYGLDLPVLFGAPEESSNEDTE
jgi:lambda family phage portal protein